MRLPARRTCLALAALLIAGAPMARAEAPRYAESLQVVYDPVSKAVTRQMVRVVDPHPGLGLGFVWDPDPGNWPGIDDQGRATGPGTLTWLIPGAASYDRHARHDRYTGTLKAGAFDGPGVLVTREGERFEGNWRAGRLEGDGSHLHTDGGLYEGPFLNGLAEGEGTFRSAEGWIYEGGFRGGLRDGKGRMRLPGGQLYDVVMERGVEVSSTRPKVIEDTTLSGLLAAQGGGAAAKVSLGVVSDQRIAGEADLSYSHYLDGNGLQVFPSEKEVQDVWTGQGRAEIPWSFSSFGESDWLASRAFLDIDLHTTDGSRVPLSSLDLAVDYSAPHLKPMLNPEGHSGCIGFRPDFEITNWGWGPVAAPKLQVAFANPETWTRDLAPEQQAATQWYDVPLDGFDQGTDVNLSPLLRQLGVDIGTLASNRFSCPSYEMMDSCMANLAASVDFGALSGLVGNAPYVATTAIGRISYSWTDAWGSVQPVTESFAVTVHLARIELPPSMAEMGDGGAYAPPAPEFLDVELPVGQTNYRINLPVRGNPNISALTSYVKLWARQSSLHALHVEASFADGSVRSSVPVFLFFVSPRRPEFTSSLTPTACYLSEF